MPIEVLDIGVIMGSQAMFVFEDMVKRYPGAEYFYNDFKSRCTCRDDPDCPRRAMQDNLEALFGEDKDQCAKFFELLNKIGHQPTETEIRQTLSRLFGHEVSSGRSRKSLTELLQDLSQDGSIKVIGFPRPD